LSLPSLQGKRWPRAPVAHSRVLSTRGAQAISALAYGTETISHVDKIVGPGNLFVTAAKRHIAFDCAIDMLAGPTEIVVTSERGNAGEIASDLVAQAEHDPEALAISSQPSGTCLEVHAIANFGAGRIQ